jgi:putative phosphoribosyl transferase
MWGRVETGFRDRQDGGRRLAAKLVHLRGSGALVLALPRGGVVIGYELAVALDLELDVIVARKVGAPGNPEYAIGAIAPGATVLASEVIAMLGVPEDYVAGTIRREQEELRRRERLYRGDLPAPVVAGRTVLVVDDGLATGATARAALMAVRDLGPGRLLFAAPVVAPDRARRLRDVADEVVWVLAPAGFHAVGQFYEDFRAAGDEQVLACLARARSLREPAGGPGPA